MSRPLPPNHIFAIVNRPVDHEYLHKVFSHPAGLSTARTLVETMLRNDAQRSARGVNSAQSHLAVAHSLNTNSNSTMPAALREVLRFSGAETQPSCGNGPSTLGQLQSQEAPDRSLVPLSPRPSVAPSVSSKRNPLPNHKPDPTSSSKQARPISQPVSMSSSYNQKQSSTSSAMLNPSEIEGFHPVNPRPQAAQRPLYAARPLAPYPQVQPLHPQPILASASQSRSSTPKPVKIAPKKRKADDAAATTQKSPAKKAKGRKPAEKTDKPNKDLKAKSVKKKAEVKDLDDNIWMRVLEFAPVSFLPKARLISKRHKNLIDNYQSILINQRIENYGPEMPAPYEGMSERLFANLLGSHKGCLNINCNDKNASRTHWSWQKRWCVPCWRQKLEREDRILKNRAHQYPRSVLIKMLECIPSGMHDSFLKPHDFVDDAELRPRGAPRLYTYYMLEDVDKIIAKYEALSPAPYVENPDDSPEAKAAAAAAYQDLMNNLEEKRNKFFTEHKAENDKRMKWVKEVEASLRQRRKVNGVPHEKNRNGRRELFTRRAKEDIFALYPGMDEEFLRSTKAFKDATRVYRDAGTERGWQTLKPKIIKEWEERPPEKDVNSATGTPAPVSHNMQRGNSTREENSARIAPNNASQHQVQQTTSLQMMHPTPASYHNGADLHNHMPPQQQQNRQMQALQMQQQPQARQAALLAQQTMHRNSSFIGPIGQQSYNIPTYNNVSVSSHGLNLNAHIQMSPMPTNSYPANPAYGLPAYSNNNLHQTMPQTWHQPHNNMFQNPHHPLHHSESSKMAISSLLTDTNNRF